VVTAPRGRTVLHQRPTQVVLRCALEVESRAAATKGLDSCASPSPPRNTVEQHWLPSAEQKLSLPPESGLLRATFCFKT
jgi:hypothetical protein